MRNNFGLYSILTALILLILTPFALAEEFDPGTVKVSTDAYVPEIVDLPRGVYKYKVRWQGIPVANAKVTVWKDQLNGEPHLRVQADAKTVSGIDWLYELRHRTESLFHAATYNPVKFQFRQRENSKRRFREVFFEKEGAIRSERWKNGQKRSPISFVSDNKTLDPVSAAFLARSIPVEVGKVVKVDVFNGKNRYLISFEVVKKEMVKTKTGKRLAYKVVPTVKSLTSTKKTKLKSATLWVSADERRDILKLRSEVFIGSVNAELVKFYPEKKDLNLSAKHAKSLDYNAS